jgi:hypothetical protein
MGIFTGASWSISQVMKKINQNVAALSEHFEQECRF